MKRDYAYTCGALDDMQLEGNLISASGWVVGLEGDVSNLRIESAGTELAVDNLQFRIDSPDVEKARPDLPTATNCRFKISAKLPKNHASWHGTSQLFSVIPMVGDRRGIQLERVTPLTLKTPTPEQSVAVGHGDFVETSFSMLSLFRLVGHLSPSAHILDPGCGIGRIAYALAHFLNEHGSYEGFDVSKDVINLAKVIFATKRRFAFQHVDLYNKMYNPAGNRQASDFLFPFASERFDFTIMTSVFTHLLPDAVENFLAEISRTLAHGGSCFATFFVLDTFAKEKVAAGSASLNISHQWAANCYVQSLEVPEAAVAYEYQALLTMINSAGLIAEQVHFGSWSGRPAYLSYQDVLLLRKP